LLLLLRRRRLELLRHGPGRCRTLHDGRRRATLTNGRSRGLRGRAWRPRGCALMFWTSRRRRRLGLRPFLALLRCRRLRTRLGLRLPLARLRLRRGLRALLGARLLARLLTWLGRLLRLLLTLPVLSRRLVLPLRLRRRVASVRLVGSRRIAVRRISTRRIGAACGALLCHDLAADGLRGVHLAHQP